MPRTLLEALGRRPHLPVNIFGDVRCSDVGPRALSLLVGRGRLSDAPRPRRIDTGQRASCQIDNASRRHIIWFDQVSSLELTEKVHGLVGL